jgi:hypothetical protein
MPQWEYAELWASGSSVHAWIDSTGTRWRVEHERRGQVLPPVLFLSTVAADEWEVMAVSEHGKRLYTLSGPRR